MPATIAWRSTPAATASSMTSAMKTEQCWPSETPASASRASSPRCDDVAMPENLRALLLDEGAGAGAAGLVHRRVDHAALRQPDVLRVLTADLEDRVDSRVVVQRALGVGGDLVEHEDALDAVAGGQQRARRSRGRCRWRRVPAPAGCRPAIRRTAASGSGPPPPGRPRCRRSPPRPSPGLAVEGDHLGAGGADVEAEHQGPVVTGSRGAILRHARDPRQSTGSGERDRAVFPRAARASSRGAAAPIRWSRGYQRGAQGVRDQCIDAPSSERSHMPRLVQEALEVVADACASG